jgi:oligogalacturonide lyase
MADRGRHNRAWTRRAFLPTLAGPLFGQAGRAEPLEADWRRYPDPATEFEVLRLTDPAYESHFVSPPARGILRRGNSLVFSSNRSGTMQVRRLELGNGQSRVLTQAANLAPSSLCLHPDDRGVLYADGTAIRLVQINGSREQSVAEVRPGWKLEGPLAPTEDGTALFWTESRDGVAEARRMRVPRGNPETIFAAEGGMRQLAPHPRRALLLWLDAAGALWQAEMDGSARRKLDTPAGNVLQACWSPEGRTILYLLDPAEPRELNALREREIDGRQDRLVAKTSQFTSFAPNANASVFLGASGSVASPVVLLLLRLTRRELTLCEHRSSQPAAVAPAFAPNSQRVFFESDRHGKPALYSMLVDKLVEKTET